MSDISPPDPEALTEEQPVTGNFWALAGAAFASSGVACSIALHLMLPTDWLTASAETLATMVRIQHIGMAIGFSACFTIGLAMYRAGKTGSRKWFSFIALSIFVTGIIAQALWIYRIVASTL